MWERLYETVMKKSVKCDREEGGARKCLEWSAWLKCAVWKGKVKCRKDSGGNEYCRRVVEI